MITAYFILLAFVAFHACDGSCPYGYTKYHKSCYRASHDARSWTNAMHICQKEGGYLAEITDVGENDFVKDLTHPPKDANYAWYAVYYIGGTNNENGHWMWATSNTHVSFTNWRHSPSKQTRGCIVLNTNDAYWNHLDCNGSTGYVCEHAEVNAH